MFDVLVVGGFVDVFNLKLIVVVVVVVVVVYWCNLWLLFIVGMGVLFGL